MNTKTNQSLPFILQNLKKCQCGATDHLRITSLKCKLNVIRPRNLLSNLMNSETDVKSCNRCHATDHLRMTSKLCPFNKNRQNLINQVIKKIN